MIMRPRLPIAQKLPLAVVGAAIVVSVGVGLASYLIGAAAVSHLTGRQLEGVASQVVHSLLEEPPAEISGLGDGALVLWLDALGDGVAANLSGLLTSDLNDEQVTRLSQYAFDHAPQLGLPFILDVLPGLLTTSERPQTVESVTSNYAALLPLAPSRNEKSSLVAVLIECLPAMSGEQLARTAALVASLSGKGALEKRSDILVRLDSGQIEIVARQIPSSSALAQRVKEATAE